MGRSNSMIGVDATSAPAHESNALSPEQRLQFTQRRPCRRELERAGPEARLRSVAVVPAKLERSGARMGLDHQPDVAHHVRIDCRSVAIPGIPRPTPGEL